MQLLHISSEKGEQSSGGVAGRLTTLALQQLHQEVDVAHGQTQDLILAQLLLRRMGGDEFTELGEGGVDVVLAPPFPRIGKHLPGHGELQQSVDKKLISHQVILKSSFSVIF